MSSTSGLEQRFWSKVDKSGECWLWTAATDRKGYGRIWVDGQRRQAHRVAYVLSGGEIPEGMLLDHRCHHTACVRPEHLRLATNKQNQENRSGAQCNSHSGARGVYWNRQCQRWHARVKHHGRQIHVGLFDSLAEAEAAVAAKRRELFTHSDMDEVSA